MQMDSPMPDFDLDSPEEYSLVTRPDGRAVRATSESQFYRNCLRCFHKAKKEGKIIRPPNAELLERWRQDDLTSGWASRIAKGRPN
jgi:hypothetical protein